LLPCIDLCRASLGHNRNALVQLEQSFSRLRATEGARLIVTGDLTASGALSVMTETNQFAIASRFLNDDYSFGEGTVPIGLQLGKTSRELLIPGNHDHWKGEAKSLDRMIFSGRPLPAGAGILFDDTPFVRRPIGLGGGVGLVFIGIDSDADSTSEERLMARGSFTSQLETLRRSYAVQLAPNACQIRVLLMHHSPMQAGYDDGGALAVNRASRSALERFVRDFNIAVILTGHIHTKNDDYRPIDGSRKDLLELRCSTASVYDRLPSGWKKPAALWYQLPPNIFFVHRLYEVRDAGRRTIQWRTNWYLRSGAGFHDQGSLMDDRGVTLWPR
jgi:predicted phosphohydrolase